MHIGHTTMAFRDSQPNMGPRARCNQFSTLRILLSPMIGLTFLLSMRPRQLHQVHDMQACHNKWSEGPVPAQEGTGMDH